MVGVNMQRRPGDAWDDPAKDIAKVIQWVAQNISRYKGNPGRVFMWAQSAGNVPVGTYMGHSDFYGPKGVGLKGVVFHCFSGSAEQAKQLLDRGYYLSFTGVVTFKNADATRAAARAVPLDRLMVETDAPYMSPEPMRKQKPNEPALMVYTAELLAELKGVSLDNLAQATTRNASEFFRLTRSGRAV